MARKKPPQRRRREASRRCLGCEDEVAEVTVELRSRQKMVQQKKRFKVYALLLSVYLGATIDTQRTSQTYDCRESWVCRILYFFWTANPPDTILQPNVSPGSCWAFKGHEGQVVIKLPARVHLTAITVQHITKDVSPSGTVISAPKDIAVFDVLPPRAEAFSYVKLLVKSNWGNPWYTCIYRVQVHGRLEEQKASTEIRDE
ncbi:sperm-associated antigen 4 protein-like protein [Pitangus sulphuratus]|nr:sperm-associated antigen 4 protein-like protein [Pitangus sulphuratus]